MHIATPCHEAWDGMAPRHGGRHCAVCDKTVIDLTALTPAARRVRLAALTQDAQGGARLCVRSAVERDGALAGSRRVLTGGMAMLLAMTLAGCMGDGPQVEPQATAEVLASSAVESRATATPLPLTRIDLAQTDGTAATTQRNVPREVMGEIEEAPEPVIPQTPPKEQRVFMGAMRIGPPPAPEAPHAAN